jgi:hypothetical protein
MIARWFGTSPDLYLAWAILIVIGYLLFWTIGKSLDRFGDWVESRRQPKVGAAGLASTRSSLDAIARYRRGL